ncbi:hypothetical protein KEM55_006504, partial [Ascosphaera atra]
MCTFEHSGPCLRLWRGMLSAALAPLLVAAAAAAAAEEEGPANPKSKSCWGGISEEGPAPSPPLPPAGLWLWLPPTLPRGRLSNSSSASRNPLGPAGSEA